MQTTLLCFNVVAIQHNERHYILTKDSGGAYHLCDQRLGYTIIAEFKPKLLLEEAVQAACQHIYRMESPQEEETIGTLASATLQDS